MIANRDLHAPIPGRALRPRRPHRPRHRVSGALIAAAAITANLAT